MDKKETYSILDLKKRFVKDFNLPINLFGDEIFSYLLDLLEERYSAKTLWERTLAMIESEFDNDINKFLSYYYEVREGLIQFVINRQAYKDFISSKDVMEQYNFDKNDMPYKHSDIYNCENKDKIFLSIDLNKANYASLMFHNPLILCDDGNKDMTYEKWLSKFTNNEYIKSSKYFRQVLFGKLCVSRQIKIEKFMSLQMLSLVKNEFEKSAFHFNIVNLHTDEVIIELLEPSEIDAISKKTKEILECNKSTIPCKYEIFRLKIYQFLTHNKNVIRAFEKDSLIEKKKLKFKGVSSLYVPQILKLIKNEPIIKFDKMFSFENQECMFLHELIKLKNDENK